MSLVHHRMAAEAAQAAVDAAVAKYGADHGAFLYCGFAWVNIKPARGALVSALKANNIGSTGVYGGYQVSSNAMFKVEPKLGQSMELKEIAARAYADKLHDLGYTGISVGTRDD